MFDHNGSQDDDGDIQSESPHQPVPLSPSLLGLVGEQKRKVRREDFLLSNTACGEVVETAGLHMLNLISGYVSTVKIMWLGLQKGKTDW